MASNVPETSDENDLTLTEFKDDDNDQNNTPKKIKKLLVKPKQISHSLSFLEKDEIVTDIENDEASMISNKKSTKNIRNNFVMKFVDNISLYFKKIDNRMQYLASVFIDNNPHLLKAFHLLQVNRIDQISLLDLWDQICSDRPKMSYKEWDKYYKFSLFSPIGGEHYSMRLFRELNLTRSSDASSISFEHWATGMIRWCTYSYHNLLGLSFRLMSRSGGCIDELGSYRSDGRGINDEAGDGRDEDIDPYFKQYKKYHKQVIQSFQNKNMKKKNKNKVSDEFIAEMEADMKPLEPPAFDLTDLRQWFDHICFAAYGYGSVAPRKNDKVKSVMRIYGLMNLDDSGGVDLDEFARFAWRNPGCLVLAHIYQERMRQVVFGKEFWENRRDKLGGKLRKTRKAKAAKNKLIRESQEVEDETISPHHHHHHHHDTTSPNSKEPISPSQRKLGYQRSNSHRKSGHVGKAGGNGSPKMLSKSFMSFTSFNEDKHGLDVQNGGGVQNMNKFIKGGHGIDIDGDDDAWVRVLDNAVLEIRKIDKLKLILESMNNNRPKSTSNIPGGGLNNNNNKPMITLSQTKNIMSESSFSSPMCSPVKRQNSSSLLGSPSSSSSPLASPSSLTSQKSVHFNTPPKLISRKSKLGAVSPNSGSFMELSPGMTSSIEDDRAEQEAKRKVEQALTKVQRERFTCDFSTVVAKSNWEVAGKKREELGVTERTFRKAIPDTRWPVVSVKLNIEAFVKKPNPPAEVVIENNKKTIKDSDDNLYLDIPSLDALDDDDDVKATEIVVPPPKTSPKSSPKITSSKSGGWLSRAAGAVGNQINRLATPTKSKRGDGENKDPKYQIKLSISVELEDVAGIWPNGESIAKRVLIAEELNQRGQAREAIHKQEMKIEAHLLRLQRFNLKEYDGGLYKNVKNEKLICGIGWDGGPMGPPWIPGGSTSFIKGGTGAKERELIEFTTHELKSDYIQARDNVTRTAVLTNGEARHDPALILTSNYR